MRFRGRAAIAMLSAALAFSRPPMHDAFAEKKQDEKYAKMDAKIAKIKTIPAKDYSLSFLKPLMKKGIEQTAQISDHGDGGKPSFRLKTKKIKMSNGNNVWILARISKWEHKTGVIVNRKVPKGKYVTNVFLSELEKRLKKKEMKYLAVGIDRKNDENGKAKKLDFYIIPVDSFEDAKNGNIKAGVPMLVINCDGKGKCNGRTGYNIHNVVDG